MSTGRNALLGIGGLGGLVVAMVVMLADLPDATLASAGEHVLVITQADGDQGLLAPFAHRRNGLGYLYTSYVFDSLVGQDAHGKVAPALAESWRELDGGLAYDIRLRQNAQWHDGVPVTAADVAFTFSYLSSHPYPFATVEGIASVTVISDTQIHLTLKQRDASFLSHTLMALPILPEHVYADQARPERFTGLDAATGSGPYRLISYDKVQGRYLLQRNRDYYDGAPRYEQLALVRMAPDRAIEAMRADEVDIVSDLPMDRVEYAKKQGLNVVTALGNHPVRLVFNSGGSLGDRNLRRGIAYGIDRQALVKIVHRGDAVIAETGYLQRGSPWFSVQSRHRNYAYDPEQAAVLFETSGWQSDDGVWQAGGRPVQLRLITDKRHAQMATVIADQLERLGIGIALRVLERGALQERIASGDYDLRLSSSSAMGDPNGLRDRVLGDNWRSDRYPDHQGGIGAVLDAQARASDAVERKAILARFQTLYAEELPAYMLTNPYLATAYSNRVHPYYLPDGVAIGIPLALPKSVLLASPPLAGQ